MVYFTPDTANAALPDVVAKYEYALKCRDEVEKAEKEINFATSHDAKLEEFVRLKQALNSKVSKFYTSIEQLESTGVMAKSLDSGLLDFPAKRFQDEVWLCWKEGETEIKFWHEKHSGFTGRKPIQVSKESLV